MSFYKSINCGSLRKSNIGERAKVSGWVLRRRDHGGVIFIDLRDMSGYCQIVFRPEVSEKCHKIAEHLRSEYVICAEGKIIARTEENINPKMKTGEIEIEVDQIEILASSKTPPFELDDDSLNVHEDIRLKYRYLDLRRPKMQQNIIMKHKFTQAIREELNNNDFIDIETPMLNKSTPEGARDFIVPSRMHAGQFYALPQSPQIFKQILMISGFEKYYQIVRCFRDEDLRSDRQPEFTQVDLECSFITQEEIMQLMEKTVINSINKVFKKNIQMPVPRLTYKDAMERFGSDRPDTRFELEIINFEDAVKDCEFKVFQNILQTHKGIIRGLCVKDGIKLSRKDIEDYTKYISIFGAKGLAWMRVTENGLESNIVKFFPEISQKNILSAAKAEPGDLIFFVADDPGVVYAALGNLRLSIAEKLNLINKEKYNFLWVYDFPMFEYDHSQKLTSLHHPFTMVNQDHIELLDSKPTEAVSLSYDFVLNGVELGGGSIRINDIKLQQKIFNLLGINEKDAEDKFGFLLEALSFGAPPHGGIAFGLDRIIMMMMDTESIRDVIAFPKTQRGQCLMSNAPSQIDQEQLEELHINIEE